MLSTHATQRLAGALLIASVLLFLGHVVTLLGLGPGRTTIVFVLVYGFPIGLAGLALYSTFRGVEPTLAAFGAFGLAAHSLFVVLTAALLLAGLRFPDQFATFGAAAMPGMGVASVLELTMDKIRTSAFVFLGLGLLPVGLLIARSGSLARWVGWLGVVAGAVAFVSMLAHLSGASVGPLVGILTQVTALAVFGFMVVLGVQLLVGRMEPGRAAEQPAGVGLAASRRPMRAAKFWRRA